MATGLTCKIKDDISFEEFAMTCARSMGACITMRDDPMDAPIPKFEPSTHHVEALQSAIDVLCDVEKMPLSVAWNQSRKEYRAHEKYLLERIKEAQELRAKYEAMLVKVQAWEPPSPDHVEFKQFMIQQITDSIKFDCIEDYYIRQLGSRPQSPKKYLNDIREKAISDIIYHNNENKNEIQRVNKRNQWICQLHNSLKLPIKDENRNGEGYQG